MGEEEDFVKDDWAREKSIGCGIMTQGSQRIDPALFKVQFFPGAGGSGLESATGSYAW